MTELSLTLPFPPSVNSYWRSPNKGPLAGRTLISARGRAYRTTVWAVVKQLYPGARRLTERLGVTVQLCPPDRRTRDLDNYLKGLLDALTHAGVWADDSQIDELTIVRGPLDATGHAVVGIRQLETTP